MDYFFQWKIYFRFEMELLYALLINNLILDYSKNKTSLKTSEVNTKIKVVVMCGSTLHRELGTEEIRNSKHVQNRSITRTSTIKKYSFFHGLTSLSWSNLAILIWPLWIARVNGVFMSLRGGPTNALLSQM